MGVCVCVCVDTFPGPPENYGDQKYVVVQFRKWCPHVTAPSQSPHRAVITSMCVCVAYIMYGGYYNCVGVSTKVCISLPSTILRTTVN